MKASFENHEKVVELLVSAGATLDFLHEVHILRSTIIVLLALSITLCIPIILRSQICV